MSRIIKVEVAFEIGEIVYIGTDADQAKYIVLGYSVRHDTTLYELYSHSNGEYIAYALEISIERELQL